VAEGTDPKVGAIVASIGRTRMQPTATNKYSQSPRSGCTTAFERGSTTGAVMGDFVLALVGAAACMVVVIGRAG